MSIRWNEKDRALTLETAGCTYQMAVDRFGFLRHMYYGRKVPPSFLGYLFRKTERPSFSGNPYENGLERTCAMDEISLEFGSCGVGDYRVSSVRTLNPDGSRCADPRYVSHTVRSGKYALPGLPAARDTDGDAQTLEVVLEDTACGLRVRLLYAVLEKKDIIARAAVYENLGHLPLVLEKAGSACLDLPFGSWDLLHFHGRHCAERTPERMPVANNIMTVGSSRGMSSHQHNPFIILCDQHATEDHGDCYGLMFLYSGSFRAEVERGQFGTVRAVVSPGDETFRWTLVPGESFVSPEVLLSFADGLTRLSQQYHAVVRENVCRGKYALAHRPVLINSWEAAYFNIRPESILDLARRARDLGVELFVLDDGWFKGRIDDNRALGDWVEDRSKLPEGLGALISDIRKTGLRFGLWVEPEMISEDSDLYRAHPDWALTVPGRKPVLGRNQLVLDLSRPDVQDFIIGFVAGLLESYDISYIKWDFNRCVSDVYSRLLPADRQGEVPHRFVLGLYRVLETLVTRFPHVLFEGCAGGGGRFDAGMLYYTPQIWCSDDTDPLERLTIQKGTTFAYPLSAVGAHVSIAPNHQTGRTTPIATRGAVAMAGGFGYELDLSKVSAEDLEIARTQIRDFLADEPLLQQGLYFRLDEQLKGMDADSWLLVSREKDRALLTVVVTATHGNALLLHLKLKGLDPDALYLLREENLTLHGSVLMHAGFTLPRLSGDYPAFRLHLDRVASAEASD